MNFIKNNIIQIAILMIGFTLLVMTFGCSKNVGTKISESTNNSQQGGLNKTRQLDLGYLLKQCFKEHSEFLYAAKVQEFGDPWLKQDTFIFYHSAHQVIDIVFLGGANNVDSAKKRIEARLPLFELLKEHCALELSIQTSELNKHLHITYAKIDKESGNIQDIIYFARSKFDFPSSSAAMYYSKWLQNRANLQIK